MMNGMYAGKKCTFNPLIGIQVYFPTSDTYTTSSTTKTVRLFLVRTCNHKSFRVCLTKAKAEPTIQRVNCIFIEPNFCESLNRWPGFRGVRSRPGIARSRSTGLGNSKSGGDLGESCLRQEKASVGILMTDSMLKAAVSCMAVHALMC